MGGCGVSSETALGYFDPTRPFPRFVVREIDRGGGDRDLNLRAARLRKSLIQKQFRRKW
jgi:hypothetical protein